MTIHLFRWQYRVLLGIIAVSLVVVVFMTSCGISQVKTRPKLMSVSCKNESTQELWDVRIVIGDRSFGPGYINIDKKKTMVVGSLTESHNIIVHYSFYPADNNPKSIVEKVVLFSGEDLAGVVMHAGEVEVVCKGDAKWIIRVYERADDHNGQVIFEEDMVVPETKP